MELLMVQYFGDRNDSGNLMTEELGRITSLSLMIK